MTQTAKSKMTPERAIEICNAINIAINAGKIVTLDDAVVTIQVGGAIPRFAFNRNVHCIQNFPVVDNTVQVINTEGYIMSFHIPYSNTTP